ncbi:hypothetical protein VNO77_03588 [Canavalia gladiata]|uniref:Uncharacterized protein n=1 Tax=Canavalia gladiata TaxID=3824 RepID=A0AAN9R8A1_CANGL
MTAYGLGRITRLLHIKPKLSIELSDSFRLFIHLNNGTLTLVVQCISTRNMNTFNAAKVEGCDSHHLIIIRFKLVKRTHGSLSHIGIPLPLLGSPRAPSQAPKISVGGMSSASHGTSIKTTNLEGGIMHGLISKWIENMCHCS